MVQPIDFDESLQRIQFIFRCSGLTVESKKVTPLTKLKKRCVYILNFFWLNSDVLGGIYWFVDGVRTGKTFVELTFIAPCVTFSFLANLKTIFLIHYEDSVCDLIEELRKLDREGVVDIDNLKTGSREKIVFRNRIKGNVNLRKRQNKDYKGVKSNDKVTKDNMRREYIEFLHSVLKCSNILSVALVAMFTATPLILIALKYYQTKEVELVLPFLIIYPFDSHDIRYWPFVYLHQFWSVSVVLLNICAADNLLYISCTYLGVQFHVLQYDIENVVEKNCVLMDHELEEFQEKYVQLINRHQELIRLTSMLDFVYAKSTLFNFVFSSVLICLTGFNVIAMENVALAVSFLVFLSANLLQIFMLCFFGDFLMKSSTEVSDAVYHSKWYYLNAKSGKNLLIVQTRAQKPCKLTAFGFSDVNLKAFINVLSNAWSYFVLLKTVYSPPKN